MGLREPLAFRTIKIPAWAWPLLVTGVWLGIYGVAKATGNWETSVLLSAFQQVIRSGLLEQRTWGFF